MRIVLVMVGIALLASACGSGSTPSGTVRVVASTNVYGEIAKQIGRTHVQVTSILTNPEADPHLFEPGTADGLAVAKADVVIVNGVGYDAFMTKLVQAAPSSHRVVLTIAEVVGVSGPDANPHFWYDVPRLPRIAGAIAATLERADPTHRRAYAKGLREFVARLGPLDKAVARIRSHSGTAVAYTEPLAGYLLTAAGLRNLAPAAFTRAIENGTEPPPQAVSEMAALVAKRRAKVLLYNNQATSPITSRVRSAAERAGVPVVGMSETLPPHLTFQHWQLAQARALARALGG